MISEAFATLFYIDYCSKNTLYKPVLMIFSAYSEIGYKSNGNDI